MTTRKTEESTASLPSKADGSPDDERPPKGAADPKVRNTLTLERYSRNLGGLSINDLVGELVKHTKQLTEKDSTALGEELLASQALALDAIFNNLALRAANAEYANQLDTYMRLALKAQSQCRTTWDAIGKLKHPPNVAFVKQANISNNGLQQVVNNGTEKPSRAEKPENPPNKQLEVSHDQRLDTRAPTAATGTDTDLETVGAFHRSQD